jgi:hypothetical protein
MSWNKVWLLEGCPYFIDWFVEDLVDDLGAPNIIRLDSNTSANDFVSALTAFPFYDVPDLLVVNNPDAEILNACLTNIDQIRCSGVIFICDYNTFDGRQSFISKAVKNKRLKTFDFFEQGDDLSEFFKTWKQRAKFSIDCLPWLNKNAPTRLAKAKVNGQKKEVIIVDLLKLDRELNKVYALFLDSNQVITSQDLENYCSFHRESEIWAFLDAVIAGDLSAMINYFNKNKLTTSNEGPLWVISSQLELYLQIKEGEKFAEKLTLSDKLNYYLSDNFEPMSEFKPKPAINPFRFKMALETCNKIRTQSLVNKYLATISAIRDLRAGMPAEIISGLLCLAYSEKNTYLDPFYDV